METNEIQEQIDSAEVELADRRSQLQAAERRLADIEAEFDEKADLATNRGDASAKQWLKKAKDELSTAEFAVKTLRPAVKAISERIIKLTADKAEASRKATDALIDSEIAAMLGGDSIEWDMAVATFCRVYDSMISRRDKIISLSKQINKDCAVFTKLATHMQRSLNEQLFGGGENPLMMKNHRELYSQPFSKFLQTMLKISDQPEDSGVVESTESTDTAEAS